MRKIAHPDDTMYRALRKHTFLYRGGIPSFDETLKREGQLLPCEVVVYSDEENLYLIYGKLISMKAPLTDRMLKEQCFVLSNVNGVTIRKLESASKQAGVEILYNNGSFIMENYMWSEEFLQEKIAVEINDAHAFFFKSLKSAKKEQEDICGEATLAQYKGLIESFAEKWAGKGA